MRIRIKNEKTVKRTHSGFTLIELMVTILISTIIMLAIGVLVVDSSGWFSQNYSKINSDPAVESLLARKTFERIIRQASDAGFSVSDDGTTVEINYHSSPDGGLDSYAIFYIKNVDELWLESGTLPGTMTSDEKICSNVEDCIFKTTGSAVQMILVLDDEQNKCSSVTSAILHN